MLLEVLGWQISRESPQLWQVLKPTFPNQYRQDILQGIT